LFTAIPKGRRTAVATAAEGIPKMDPLFDKPTAAIEIHKWGIAPSEEVVELVACFHRMTYKFTNPTTETGEERVKRLLREPQYRILWTGLAVDYRYGSQVHDCMTVLVKIKKS